jgi:hypothetical protein
LFGYIAAQGITNTWQLFGKFLSCKGEDDSFQVVYGLSYLVGGVRSMIEVW